MDLRFNLEYHTMFGEMLALNVVSSDNEGEKVINSYKMSTIDGQNWSCDINSLLKTGTYLDYFYTLLRDEQEVRREWTLETHRLELVATKAKRYVVYDHWIDIPANAYLYSSAMTECINRHERLQPRRQAFARTVRLKVRAPQLHRNERLAVVGNETVLGNWLLQNAVVMVEHNFNEWIVDIDATKLSAPRFEMKFVVLHDDDQVAPIWENCDNRSINLPEMADGDVVVYELPEASFSSC
jgi:4-alpha-glucanotransferase